jgi:hypothetical protein
MGINHLEAKLFCSFVAYFLKECVKVYGMLNLISVSAHSQSEESPETFVIF